MDCRSIKKLLSPSVDNQLTPDDQRRVDEHTRSCAACRAELADLHKMVGHLRNIEQIEPPPWMTQKIMARIRAEVAQPQKSFWERLFGVWPMKVPLGAMATVMLAFFVVMIFRSIQPELTPDVVQDAPKQPAPATESILKKETAPAAAKTEVAPETRRAKAEKAAPEKPAPATPAIRKDKSPALPHAGSSAPVAEQPAKGWKQEAGPLEESARYEKRDAADGMVRTETFKAKKSAPSPAMRNVVPGALAVSGITVVVADVDAAAAQVRAAVLKSGGRVVSSESATARHIITVELSPEKLAAFRAHLKDLGLVTERLVVADDKALVSRVRIEIVPVQ